VTTSRDRLQGYAILLALVASLSIGCHHQRAQTAVTPSARPGGEHCWWAAYRTAMSPDSVAARYARAYTTVGLSNSGWSHSADTAWAEAGPTALSRDGGTRTYAARVVAIRRGDTTFFRPFQSVQLQPADSRGKGALTIPFCADLSRAAMTGGTAPRDEEPDDSLPLWRRRPTR
jgi:hypothetical protein